MTDPSEQPDRLSQQPAKQPSKKQAKSEARAEALARLKAEEKARRRKRTILQSVVGLVVVLLVVGGAVFLLNRQDDSGGGQSPADIDGAVPAAAEDNGGFVVGNPDAKVTVTVVEDFQCPVCKGFEAAAGDLLDSYAAGDDVKVEYRGIAFLDRASSTEYSSRALNASGCVMESGADVWKEFHKQLYLQQPAEGGDGLTDDKLTEIAVAAGADESAVKPCIDDRKYADWVKAVTATAFDDDGVTGTPTLFVDGQKLNSFDPTALKSAVDQALAS